MASDRPLVGGWLRCHCSFVMASRLFGPGLCATLAADEQPGADRNGWTS